jgi:hypothetical protein
MTDLPDDPKQGKKPLPGGCMIIIIIVGCIVLFAVFLCFAALF